MGAARTASYLSVVGLLLLHDVSAGFTHRAAGRSLRVLLNCSEDENLKAYNKGGVRRGKCTPKAMLGVQSATARAPGAITESPPIRPINL